MLSTTTSAPSAHAFDPQQWLADFESLGGGHVLTDETIHLGFTVAGRSDEDQTRARQMIDRLGAGERSDLTRFLRNREADQLADALGPDAAMQIAWERRKAAFARYNALPFADDTEAAPAGIMTPAERECWDVIDSAERTIERSTATTPQAVAYQLWCAVSHTTSDRAQEAAAIQGDLATMTALHGELDWNTKLIVAAIRSLQAIEA